jgi:hypothetical protein
VREGGKLGAGSERQYIGGGVKEAIFSVLKVPRQYSLVLLLGVKCMIIINSKFNFYGVRGAAMERKFVRK